MRLETSPVCPDKTRIRRSALSDSNDHFSSVPINLYSAQTKTLQQARMYLWNPVTCKVLPARIPVPVLSPCQPSSTSDVLMGKLSHFLETVFSLVNRNASLVGRSFAWLWVGLKCSREAFHICLTNDSIIFILFPFGNSTSLII